jgi:hypothetical protein
MSPLGERSAGDENPAFGRGMGRGKRTNGTRPTLSRTDEEYLAIWQARYDEALEDDLSPSMARFRAGQELARIRKADAGRDPDPAVFDYDVDAFAAWR